GPDDGRFEPARLSYGPSGHESAVAPAADAEAVGVGDSSLDEMVDAGQDVPQVLAPQVADVRFGERPPPADASARVWQENGNSPRCQQARVLDAVEAGVMRRGWSAVNPGHHRIAATTLVPNR